MINEFGPYHSLKDGYSWGMRPKLVINLWVVRKIYLASELANALMQPVEGSPVLAYKFGFICKFEFICLLNSFHFHVIRYESTM